MKARKGFEYMLGLKKNLEFTICKLTVNTKSFSTIIDNLKIID